MLVFEIKGETPSKKNQRIINTRTGRSFPSKRYSEWHKTAKVHVMEQALKQAKSTDIYPIPFNKPCRIKLTFTHGDLRRRDSDNGTSSILDLLTDCQILTDDNWQIVKELQIENAYEKNKASCRVEIEICK